MRSKGNLQKIIYCSFFTALIAAGAFIKVVIPIQPMPMHITFQFFFVLIAGLILGAKNGFTSVLVYLILGIIGIPIFASGGGPAYILKPTFGFLIGFALSAFTVGFLSSKIKKKNFLNIFICCFIAMLVMYLSGMLYFYMMSNFFLGVYVSWGVVFVNCFLITLPADTILCVLASLVVVRVGKLNKLLIH